MLHARTCMRTPVQTQARDAGVPERDVNMASESQQLKDAIDAIAKKKEREEYFAKFDR